MPCLNTEGDADWQGVENPDEMIRNAPTAFCRVGGVRREMAAGKGLDDLSQIGART